MPTERGEIAALRSDVEVNRGECDRRHRDVGADLRRIKDVQIAHDRRLVAVAGEDGTNGKLGALDTRVSKIEGMVNKALLAAATGAFAGAGVVYGLFQALGGGG